MSWLERKQSRGPGAPRAVPRPPRLACWSSLGPGGAVPFWPGPCCRPPARARASGRLELRESQRRERTVRCRVFIHPSPLGLLWVLWGKVQLVTGFGALESRAGGNKQFASFLLHLEKLRFTCVTSQECIGGSYCSV